MKRLILCLILTVCIIPTVAAQEPANGDARIIITRPTLTECDATGTPLVPSSMQAIPNGSKFNIYKAVGENYIVVFRKWDVKKSDSAFYRRAKTSKLHSADKVGGQFGIETNAQKLMRLNYTLHGNIRYFLVPKGDLSSVSDALYPLWTPTLGTLSYLFKWRPSTGIFENSFNLNITGGTRVLLDRTNPNHSLAFTGGVGVTTLPKSSADRDTVSTTYTGGGITISGNIIYVWDRLQVGLSSGFDVPVGESAPSWKYRGKPWISFGIGINIFSEDKPSKESSTQ